MLYESLKISRLWTIVSQCLGIDIKWKQMVIGFPLCEDSEKDNVYCKVNDVQHSNINIYIYIYIRVNKDLNYYQNVLPKGNLVKNIYDSKLMNA